MASVRYSEGDWFAVPLERGGWAVGVIARSQPRYGGVLLGYFFGPRRGSVPDLAELGGLSAGDALLVRRFGHLGIRGGEWPVIGRSAGWARSRWPVPLFLREPPFSGPVLVQRDEDDLSRVVGRRPLTDGEVVEAVTEDLLGPAVLQKELDRELGDA